MDELPEGTQSVSRAATRVDEPFPARKVERMAQEAKGLVEDLTSWVELKLRLTQIEIEEKVEARLNKAVVGLIVGVIALVAVVFALAALAFGVGSWLGHPAWGFLAVAVLLFVVTGILHAVKPHLVDLHEPDAAEDEGADADLARKS